MLSDVVVHRSAPARRPLSGRVWFGLMVGGWGVLLALVLFAGSTLGDLWDGLRDLPLVVEGLIWLLLFPLVLATGVWESSWQPWLRVLLVACFAVGWSIAFFPRAKKARELDR